MNTALIVEDTATDMEMLTAYLKKGGYSILQATSEEEALAALNKQKPDVIFLDVVLPGRSGFELCRDLKSSQDTGNIPIIICSSKQSEIDRFWSKRQGADAHIGKPVQEQDVKNALIDVFE